MTDSLAQGLMENPKLSICITTLNRAAVLGETLESILGQVTKDCEVVVLDAASSDGTEELMGNFCRRCARVRYVRQETNNGFDRDCDRVVQLARGEYCWLMTDDDLLKPGAVAVVLQRLKPDVSLVILSTEIRDFNFSKVLHDRWPDFASDGVYGPNEMDRLFGDVGALNCNAYVIKREIWLARDRERYFGSWFSHIGVIFQEHLPGSAIVVAEPMITYRDGGAHTYSPRFGELIWVALPTVIKSLAVSESARMRVYNAEPWRHIPLMLRRRGQGYYSLREYRKWIRPHLRWPHERLIRLAIALLPGTLVNALFLLYYSVTRRRHHGKWQPELILHQMRGSPFYYRNWLKLERNV